MTEFHLIGSSPAPCSKNGKRGAIAPKPLSPQRQRAEAGCPRLPRRMAKRTSVRAEPCEGARWGARLAHSVRSPHTKKRRSSERRNKDWSGHKGLMDALRAPLPLRLKPSGEFLKTAHWAVFLTEFHLIGSSPDSCSKTKTAGAIASAVRFLERTTGLEPATPTLARWCSTN